MSEIAEDLAALIGQRIPGGCDDCDAYQVMQREGAVFVITVAHDNTCPWLRAREEQR